MTHTDPIADLLIRIKNAYLAGHRNISVPYSKIKEQIVRVMEKEGYLESVKTKKIDGWKSLVIKLLYKDGKPIFTDVKRESKPGLRKYVSKDKISNETSGLGIAIVTTSKGIMTAKEARKKGIGGEVICRVW
jgi:small subunit ribosomal protein S8